MLRCFKFLTLLLLLSPAIGFARGVPAGDSPAFATVPELSAGFDLLYEQQFSEARQIFANWESRNREAPFGEVAVAASYLFEELYLQGVLTSEFFLNEKKFLHGIDGRPNPERMSHFGEALTIIACRSACSKLVAAEAAERSDTFFNSAYGTFNSDFR